MSHYIILLYYWLRGELFAIPGRVIAAVFFILLFILPLINQEPYMLRILSLAAIYSIFATSWNLLAGYVGQISLGHALFFGVPAYVVAMLDTHLGLSPWLTITGGGLTGILMGFIAGFPVLRLKGVYLSLVTLTFPIILTGIIFAFPDFTGGELGIFGLSRLSDSRINDYYMVIITMIISLLIMRKVADSKSKFIRAGVIFHAIREDEITARTSGINTVMYKLIAYAVSGFFAGIAGGFYAHFLRVAGPSTLELMNSFQVILWSIFGGIGTYFGSTVGVFILYPLTEVLAIHALGEQIRFILFALILMLTLLFMPNGIAVWFLDRIEINCPRCKIINIITRRRCRACRAPLHLEEKNSKGGKEKT